MKGNWIEEEKVRNWFEIHEPSRIFETRVRIAKDLRNGLRIEKPSNRSGDLRHQFRLSSALETSSLQGGSYLNRIFACQ